MITIIAFLLTLIGGINWLMIGLLQYDFVAGIFGYQASILSRLIYILIGASGLILLFKMFKGKGTIAIFSRKNKKDLEKNIQKIGQTQPQTVNVEASREHIYNDMPSQATFQNQNQESLGQFSKDNVPQANNQEPSYNHNQENLQDSLFDEQLGKR